MAIYSVARKRYWRLVNEGLCYNCGVRPVVGSLYKKVCDSCGPRLRANNKKSVTKRRAEGKCVYCRGMAVDGLVTCNPCRIRQNKDSKEQRRVLREKIISNYSNHQNCCACCKESNLLFLTLDHIKDDGAYERHNGFKQNHKLHARLVRDGYPEGYQVLCFNCNCGKWRNKGVCPHVEDTLELS